VTGKWLFPQSELDRWLGSSLSWPKGVKPADPMPIVGGSYDPLLEWALRQSGSGLASLPEGSEAGLARFEAGGIVASAIHLHALSGSNEINVETVRKRASFHDAVLIAFARREQGFLAAPGNPLKIAGIDDVIRRKARMAVRPDGAGAQLLLLSLLARSGHAVEELAAVAPPCPTGADVAQAIRGGHADCGVAIRAVASAAGLAFVPITWERFDLVVRQRDYFRPPLQAFFAFIRSEAFAARARELGGYDVADTGSVRHAP
jgi:molybdate-binding protein